MKTFIRRVAPGLLAAFAAASCGDTELSAVSSDLVEPTVTVSIQGTTGGDGFDSVSVREPLQIQVNATDNSALTAVVTRVLADTTTVGYDSATFVVPSSSYNKTITIPLSGVRSGQIITVRTTVIDGSNNTSTHEAQAIAFDPQVPVLSFVRPQSTVIVGGTYTFDVMASDTTGVFKIGYRALAPGLSQADSALFGALPKSDTATFSFPVPAQIAAGNTITITPFAENRDGLRAQGAPFTVRITAPGPDVFAPVVYQTVGARLESRDSLEVSARDSDGQVTSIGFIARDLGGSIVFTAEQALPAPAQQATVKLSFALPKALLGQSLFVTGFAKDAAGHTGYAVQTGATIPATDAAIAKRDPVVFAFGLTYSLPANSLGGDIAVDESRTTVYVSNINKNQLQAFHYGTTLQALPPVNVGAMPWGMIIDNSNSLLLVANSGGTNISMVNLSSRLETGRVKTSNEWVYDVTYTKDEQSGGFKYQVAAPIDYSDRPQYIAQSASGALYYSTRPTSTATPGTLRRLDNFLDARAEPRQIWQYGSYAKGKYVIFNADHVDVIEGGDGVPDEIVICEHTPGDDPSTSTCVQALTVEGAVAALQDTPISGNVNAVKDLDVGSLALPDTNFVAVGGDRRRVVFGEGGTGTRAGRVLSVFDPSGTLLDGAIYSAPLEVADLTNNASDRVFGIDVNQNSVNIGVHGIETFFADSSLRLQGKFATFNTGAGIAFHPDNRDENTGNNLARVAFVASGDMSIQIVDSYSYRLRGRIPIRHNLYGALRAATPSAAEVAANPNLAVKIFGLTPEGLVVIDLTRSDIDNAVASQALRR